MTTKNSGKYSSIEATVEEQPSPTVCAKTQNSSYGLSTLSTTKKIIAGVGFVGVAFFCLLVATVKAEPRSSGPLETIVDTPILTSTSKVRDCTFDECYASNCDANSAPFICEFHNGGPHGGCSVIPWIEGTCDDQCNLKKCGSLDIPDSVKTCKGMNCDEDWCKNGQLCGAKNNFQCMQGSGRFGCSSDGLKWTLKTADVVCSKCCDVTTC